jgi:hypothetical protein
MGARDRKARLEPGRRLSRILSGAWRPAPPPPTVALEELEGAVEGLGATGAGGLAWWALRSSELRGSAPAKRLQDLHRAQAVRAALSQEELASALALLREEGIEPILGKGWAVARLYPSRGLRPCGDVDLYVHRQDHARGFLAAQRSGLPIDLHEECPELADRPWETLLARSRMVSLDGNLVRVFGPEDHLRLVGLHFLRHGGWRPLWLCDAAVLLEAVAPDSDWDILLAGSPRRAHWIACTLGLASELLGARLPPKAPPAVREVRLPAWLPRTALESWSRPPVPHGFRVPLREHLRRPWSLPAALGQRWPNGIEATVGVGGSFGTAPRLPFQLAEALRRTWRFLLRALTPPAPRAARRGGRARAR